MYPYAEHTCHPNTRLAGDRCRSHASSTASFVCANGFVAYCAEGLSPLVEELERVRALSGRDLINRIESMRSDAAAQRAWDAGKSAPR